ncbi:MAG: hypothetical protein B7Y08_02760 [Rhodospirillales bacterium 24-66-33]|jgi:hypothetical protein|nr:MAG: hypothetical protein B7Y57_02400 [Rhodospirillales bacterium 35-66-84]OYZ97130.1 MAG: hypothetical protein B7Y08_02760 [Rhodospirillales bacterium 24-66-33]
MAARATAGMAGLLTEAWLPYTGRGCGRPGKKDQQKMNSTCMSGLVAALLLTPALAFAQASPAPAAPPNAITHPAQKTIGKPAARQYSTALIVINARGAKLDGQKLVLDGVLPTATLFTSRPKRSVGHMVTPDMADIWRTGSFAKDPPNATVSVFHKDGGNVSDLVVTLKTAKLEGEKLTFDVDVLEGSLGAADGPASVFIDTIWFGIGSHGAQYYGQNQTTGGETPAIGDPDGTSTFSGWSNPAPTHPVNPYPYAGGGGYGSGAGAPPPPDIDPRYQQRYNAPSCGKPPLLPCY